jgi:outer membrane protein assembly factor BamB
MLLLDAGTDRSRNGQATDLPAPAELQGPGLGGEAVTGSAADGPTCTTEPGCVVWRLRLGGWRDVSIGPDDGLSMIADLLLLPRVGGLRAVDVGTGEVRWTRDLLDLVVADRPPAGVAAAGNLVLLGSRAGELTALDLGEGTPRWTTTVEGLDGVADATIVDGRLVVAGRTASTAVGRADVVAALELSDGTVHWSRRADQVALTTLGPVLAGPSERFQRIDVVTGEPAWDRELPTAALGLTGVGPVLIVDGDTDRRLLDAADGRILIELPPAPAPGLPVAEPPVVVAGLASATLIEAEGVAWTIETPGSDCCAGSKVTAADVELQLLDRASLTVDRATGEIRSSRTAPDVGGPIAWRFGDLLLVPDPSGADRLAGFGIRDAASGRNVARSSAAWPALTPDGGLLLVAPEWIARVRSAP